MRRRQPGRDLGQALGLRVQQADALRHRLGQLLDELVAAAQLALRGDQHQQELARPLGAAHDEVAQVALVRALVEGREAGRRGPRLDRVAGAVDRIPDEQADLERQHLVPAAGAVEAERGALGAGREGELDLVAVGEDRDGGLDRVELEAALVADALERVAHLRGLVPQLRLVGEVLPAAAAARTEVRAGGLDPVGALLQGLDRDRVAVASLDLRDASAHAVAGKGPVDEQDEVVEPRDAAPAEGQRADDELDLAASLGPCRHGAKRRRGRAGGRQAATAWASRTGTARPRATAAPASMQPATTTYIVV